MSNNTLKSQLKALGGEDSDFLKNLKPAVRKRVEVLRGIQSERDELEAKFFEEKAKYQKLYAPLYKKRYKIVTGAVEVDGGTDDTEKGVPEFWLTAMKHNKIMAEKITERDEEALKYLKEIKCRRMDDYKGFQLGFFFDTNPFFKNSVLIKVYHMIIPGFYHKLSFQKATGTIIEWLPGKCLTQKNASFFDFFSPETPMEPWFRWIRAERFGIDVGLTIRDKIIPHAVSWFTGEANQEGFGGFDKDDEDEEETKTKKKSQLKAMGGDVLKNLKPAVRKRVEVLRGIQSKYDELEAKYFEEKAKYYKLIAPLYSKRYDIVTGAVEVDGAKEEDAMDQTDDTEKGVPDFWLTAMKQIKCILSYHNYCIYERDEEALKYLKDIKLCRMDDPKGFKLEFFFDTNPFFTNSVLTKVYHTRSSFLYHRVVFEKAIGTTIEWLPDKCLTQKNASFFNFFSTPKGYDYVMREDYHFSLIIRDKIIPHAVSWYTGEANRNSGRKPSILLGGFYDEDEEDYENVCEDISYGIIDKHPAEDMEFGIYNNKK